MQFTGIDSLGQKLSGIAAGQVRENFFRCVIQLTDSITQHYICPGHPSGLDVGQNWYSFEKEQRRVRMSCNLHAAFVPVVVCTYRLIICVCYD